MDLTPNEVTDLILRAYEKGVERGRLLAESEQGTVRLHVRPGSYTYAEPIVKPFGVVVPDSTGGGFECAHNATTRTVNGPTVCDVCREVL